MSSEFEFGWNMETKAKKSKEYIDLALKRVRSEFTKEYLSRAKDMLESIIDESKKHRKKEIAKREG